MKLKISPKATADIAEIRNYIHEKFDNLAAANRIANKIRKSYKQLKISPYMGKSLDTVSGKKSGYRFLVSGDYLIFYIVRGDLIIVHRVIHGKRDYYKVLFEGETEGDLRGIVKI